MLLHGLGVVCKSVFFSLSLSRCSFCFCYRYFGFRAHIDRRVLSHVSAFLFQLLYLAHLFYLLFFPTYLPHFSTTSYLAPSLFIFNSLLLPVLPMNSLISNCWYTCTPLLRDCLRCGCNWLWECLYVYSSCVGSTRYVYAIALSTS